MLNAIYSMQYLYVLIFAILISFLCFFGLLGHWLLHPVICSVFSSFTVFRCQVDSSVRWLNPKRSSTNDFPNRSLRFQINLGQHWTGQNALMLQCKLAVCSIKTADTSASDGIMQVLVGSRESTLKCFCLSLL